ncbi:MAG: DUF6261 family protein [Prevotellaceae bacterium]|jgi:hypothetical protein|nr:DUF6261 family protein [Prevotellaceae bacterium]
MNKILNKPDKGRYKNAYHIEFHKLSYDICNKYATAIDAPELLAEYHDKVAQEENIYNWVRRSEYTKKKADADNARDSIFSGIKGIIRANMKHFDPSVRDNANHVNNLLINYGKLKQSGYDAETAGIENIIVRLNSADYLPAIQNLGLAPWIAELENQNTLFKNYVDDVVQEKVEKPSITSIVARRQTDEALKQITDRITSLVILNGQADYNGFIAEFNVLVNHYNTLVHEHYGRLHARIDITPAAIDAIPEQYCTGKPVFVIPELTLTVEKEGKQTILHPVFSEDFTVAYKNNVEPGTATLIIKGIGKYTGEITTTFNIEREV